MKPHSIGAQTSPSTHNADAVSTAAPPFVVDQSTSEDNAAATPADSTPSVAAADVTQMYGVQCVTENSDCEFVQIVTATGTVVVCVLFVDFFLFCLLNVL